MMDQHFDTPVHPEPVHKNIKDKNRVYQLDEKNTKDKNGVDQFDAGQWTIKHNDVGWASCYI